MSETQDTPVRRILVAIDASSQGAVVLKAAARLATELQAELQGLFIEDINLWRLAGLPFTQEVDLSSGELRPLNIEAMEQALRTRAEGVRLAIAQTAQQTSLRWSFRVSRGHLAQTMLTESVEADLLLIGSEYSLPRPAARKVDRGPIMILDEGVSSRRVHEMAQRLARMHGDPIVALIARPGPPASDLPVSRAGVFVVQRCDRSTNALIQAARQWQPQLLLVDRSSDLMSKATLDELIKELPCPLVLVQ